METITPGIIYTTVTGSTALEMLSMVMQGFFLPLLACGFCPVYAEDTSQQFYVLPPVRHLGVASVTLTVTSQVDYVIHVTLSKPAESSYHGDRRTLTGGRYETFHLSSWDTNSLIRLDTTGEVLVRMSYHVICSGGAASIPTGSPPAPLDPATDDDRDDDGVTLLPVSALGRHYVISAFPEVGDSSSRVSVTAVYEDTSVEITLPNDTNDEISVHNETFYAGETFMVNLTSYQTQFMDTTVGLSGLRFVASQPLVIFTSRKSLTSLPPEEARDADNDRMLTRYPHPGNVSAEEGMRDICDHVALEVEQTLPVRMWGKSYVIVPDPSETNITVRMMADESGADVTTRLGGLQQTFNLSQWQFTDVYPSATDYISIEADRPVMVRVHWDNRGRECSAGNTCAHSLSLTLLPTDRGSQRYMFHINRRENAKREVDIIANATSAGDLWMDGKPLTSQNDVTVRTESVTSPSGARWVVFRVDVGGGFHNVSTHHESRDCPFLTMSRGHWLTWAAESGAAMDPDEIRNHDAVGAREGESTAHADISGERFDLTVDHHMDQKVIASATQEPSSHFSNTVEQRRHSSAETVRDIDVIELMTSRHVVSDTPALGSTYEPAPSSPSVPIEPPLLAKLIPGGRGKTDNNANEVIKYKVVAAADGGGGGRPGEVKFGIHGDEEGEGLGVPFHVKVQQEAERVVNQAEAASQSDVAGGGTRLDVTVIAVIISLTSAVVLVILFVLGFLLAEGCRRDFFRPTRIAPY